MTAKSDEEVRPSPQASPPRDPALARILDDAWLPPLCAEANRMAVKAAEAARSMSEVWAHCEDADPPAALRRWCELLRVGPRRKAIKAIVDRLSAALPIGEALSLPRNIEDRLAGRPFEPECVLDALQEKFPNGVEAQAMVSVRSRLYGRDHLRPRVDDRPGIGPVCILPRDLKARQDNQYAMIWGDPPRLAGHLQWITYLGRRAEGRRDTLLECAVDLKRCAVMRRFAGAGRVTPDDVWRVGFSDHVLRWRLEHDGLGDNPLLEFCLTAIAAAALRQDMTDFDRANEAPRGPECATRLMTLRPAEPRLPLAAYSSSPPKRGDTRRPKT